MPKDTRASGYEKKRRIYIIQGWIIEGVPRCFIIDRIIKEGWVAERQAYRLYVHAMESWVKGPEAEIETKRKMKIEELKHIIRGLKEEYKGTPNGLTAIAPYQKMIIDLEGLAQPKTKVIKGDPEAPLVIKKVSNIDYTKLSDQALEEIIKARKDATV